MNELTKKEHFALEILKSMIISNTGDNFYNSQAIMNQDKLVKFAVEYAEKLENELKK